MISYRPPALNPGLQTQRIVRVGGDFGLCQANAVSMGLAPGVFDLGDDDMLHVLTEPILIESQSLVQEAARQCPRQAVAVEL